MKDSRMKVLPCASRRTARIKDAVRRARVTLNVAERARVLVCVYVGGWASRMCDCLFVCLLKLQPDARL